MTEETIFATALGVGSAACGSDAQDTSGASAIVAPGPLFFDGTQSPTPGTGRPMGGQSGLGSAGGSSARRSGTSPRGASAPGAGVRATQDHTFTALDDAAIAVKKDPSLDLLRAN